MAHGNDTSSERSKEIEGLQKEEQCGRSSLLIFFFMQGGLSVVQNKPTSKMQNRAVLYTSLKLNNCRTNASGTVTSVS